MTVNTLFQLFYDTRFRSPLVEHAHALLFMPDLFSYALTGEKYNEYTIASTSMMLDSRRREWAVELLERLGIPLRLLQPIIMPGKLWGMLSEDVQQEVGLGNIPVFAVGTHDTASAVCATPLKNRHAAYLSCGTWSLLGVELDQPLINRDAFECNFTNEGGVDTTIRYLKNIPGLWIIQQLRKKWAQVDGTIGYAEISAAARDADHIEFGVDPNHDCFIAPVDMEEAVVGFCEHTFGIRLRTIGEISRAVYNGIVSEYKRAVEGLEYTLASKIQCVNMVGGGIQDAFLCQLTADTLGKPVMTGPVEASAVGNILMQLKALNRIHDVAEGRKIVEGSFEMKEYRPN